MKTHPRRNRLGIRAWIPALLGALAMSAAASQSAIADITLLSDPEKPISYDISLDVVVRQDDQVARFVQAARMTFELDRPAGDQGVAVIKADFESLNVLYNEQGRQREFNWRAGEEPHSSSEMLSAACSALANATLRLHVALDGRVLRVDGLTESLEALAASEEIDERVLGIFGPDQIIDALTPIFSGDGLAGDDRSKGEGWQTSLTTALGPAGAIEFVTDWAVTEADGQTMAATGVESVDVKRPATPDPAAPSLTPREHAGETKTVWNQTTGRLQSRLAQRTMASEWTLGGFSIEQRQSSTFRINLAPGQ